VYIQNGFEVYDPRFEKLSSQQWPKIDHYATSRFGFKIINVGGTPQWEPATVTDFRRAEARRLGISVNQVPVKASNDCYCILDPATDTIDCQRRECPQGSHCMTINSPNKMVYCKCSK
jgi:hypothetical protein